MSAVPVAALGPALVAGDTGSTGPAPVAAATGSTGQGLVARVSGSIGPALVADATAATGASTTCPTAAAEMPARLDHSCLCLSLLPRSFVCSGYAVQGCYAVRSVRSAAPSGFSVAARLFS